MRLKEINNKYNTTNVRVGRIITETLSTELDSSTIYLPLHQAINISVNDIVEFENEANQKEYWLVANQHREYATFESPFLYNYTIELISLTKILEKIFLPNMTITNIGQNRTIDFYIRNAMSLYFKNDYISQITYTYNYNQATNVVAKEMTFQEPTLREYIDTLLSQVGGIVKFGITYDPLSGYSFKIDFLSLDSTTGTMPTENVVSIDDSQDGDDYVSVIYHTTDDLVCSSPITEYVQETTPEPVFNSSNAVLQTSRKAYDFESLTALKITFRVQEYARIYSAGQGGSSTNWTKIYDSNNDVDVNLINIDLDISDLVVTKEEYSTLTYPKKSAYKMPDNDYDSKFYFTTTSKKTILNTLVWDRDTNSITNINEYKKFKNNISNYSTDESICNALRRVAWLYFKKFYPTKGAHVLAGDQPDDTYGVVTESDSSSVTTYWTYWKITINNYDYETQIFKIKYRPYVSPKVAAVSLKEHYVTSVDTDTNTKTDIILELEKSDEKLKQSGLIPKLMLAIIPNHNGGFFTSYKLGQVWNDENGVQHVITKIEKQVNNADVIIKATLMPNYSQKILNTNLNREKRYYAYASTDLVTRKELILKIWKLELSTTQAANQNTITKPIYADYAHITFNHTSDDTKDDYLLPITPIMTKNGITYEVQTLDNIAIAQTKYEESDSSMGGLPSKLLKYVDDYGECNSVDFEIGLLKTPDNVYSSIYNESTVAGKTPIEWASIIDVAECVEDDESAVSRLFYGQTVSESINILKDNREILNISFGYAVALNNATSNTDISISFNAINYFKGWRRWQQANPSPSLPKYFKFSFITDGNDTTLEGADITYTDIFTTDFYSEYEAYQEFLEKPTAAKGTLIIYDNIEGEILRITNYRGGYINSSIENI